MEQLNKILPQTATKCESGTGRQSEIEDRVFRIGNGILQRSGLELSEGQKAGLGLFARNLIGETSKMPFLFGNPGTGKTTVAKMMSSIAFRMDLNPKIISAVELTLIAQTNVRELLQFGNHPGILVIDDIGVSGWGIKCYGNDIPVMDYLLMLRYEQFLRKRYTIVTSNVPFDRIKDYVSDQVNDRLKEMFSPVPVTGKSFRK